jgi:DNA polymerase (family 10)
MSDGADGPEALDNAAVAEQFERMADLLDAQDVAYKPRAYRRAAESLRSHPGSVARLAREDPDALESIEGVGDSIAEKVVEYVETGSIAELADLREAMPVDMAALTRVEGVGPKTVGKLYETLGVETLEDLERAAREGRIREVSGFGETTEQNILDSVAFAREASGRRRLGATRPVADRVLAALSGRDGVDRCEVAGSIRRWTPTVGDVDVLVASETPERAVAAFTDLDGVTSVIESGTAKAAVRVDAGDGRADTRVDLRVVAPEEYGAALQYFTGSKEHNVRLRTHALRRGISLNEYGAFDVSDLVDDDPDADRARERGKRVAGRTEASMYDAVGLAYVPPELREDRGEIAAAADDALPDLVSVDDLCGDLHVHTDASDGDLPVAETVAAAAEFGHDYVAITDHADGPGVPAGVGLTEAELREHVAEVRSVAADAAIEVFAGVEANVDADGDVDVSEDLLADLDIVVASPHSGLSGSDDATDRLVRAVEHPEVDVLGHPTGRLLTERSGLSVDPERLGAAAADHGVALEVNANPARLDLDGGAVKVVLERGATVAVNTDAHRPAEFEHLRYGVHTARRGWAEPGDVLNAGTAATLRATLDQ